MNTSQIQLYDLFRKDLKLDESKAKEFVQTIEQAILDEVRQDKSQIATKQDLTDVRMEIKETKVDLIKWMVGLFISFFLAIVGTMIALLICTLVVSNLLLLENIIIKYK